jgi:hypothetical protein
MGPRAHEGKNGRMRLVEARAVGQFEFQARGKGSGFHGRYHLTLLFN